MFALDPWNFYWSACIKPDKCAVMYFCVVGMLLCLFSQFFLLYFGTLPTVWYLFWFFIWFQIQNEWTHFTTILFYTKHTEHPLITNSCDVQMQVEQYWYHRLSKWPRLFLYMKPKNQFTEMNNVFIFLKYPAVWNLAMLFYTKKLYYHSWKNGSNFQK